MSSRVIVLCALGCLVGSGCSGDNLEAPLGQQASALVPARLSNGRARAAITVLADGTVLMTGGYTAPATPSNTADLFDPESGSITPVGPMNHPHAEHTSTLLPSGKVLVAGGGNPYAELYDPVTQQFTALPSMNDTRTGHTATLLPDGTVLIVGGGAADATRVQRFDPVSNGWLSAASSQMQHTDHVALLLRDNPTVVLVVGGVGDTHDGGADYRVAELYDPVVDQWAWGPTLPATYQWGGASQMAVGLPDGGALILGLTDVDFGAVAQQFDQSVWALNGASFTEINWCGEYYGNSALVLPNGVAYELGDYGGGSGCSELTLFANTDVHSFPGGGAGTQCSEPYGNNTYDKVRTVAMTGVLPSAAIFVAGGLEYTGCNTFSANADISSIRLFGWGLVDAGTLDGAGRLDSVAVPLWNGEVLMTGGSDGVSTLANAELFAPSSGAVVATLGLSSPRVHHTATALNDGRVLVAGGMDDAGLILQTADVLNPLDGGLLGGLPMVTPRAWQTATLMGDGRVLIAGGETAAGTTLSTEIFDPTTNAFTATGDMVKQRSHHGAVELRDGRILAVGGQLGSSVLKSSELFDPDGGVWTATSGMLVGVRTDLTVTEIGGHVLAAAGSSSATTGVPVPTTEWFSPDGGTWSPGPSLITARYRHTATVLPTGEVIFAGGYSASTPLTATEVFDPQNDAFVAGPTLTVPTGRHGAALMQNNVLLLGGEIAPTVVEAIHDNTPVLASLMPTVQSPGLIGVGQTVTLQGTGFTGYGENGGGTGRTTSTNYPLFFVTDAKGEHRTFLPMHDWSATGASVDVPASLLTGLYWLRVSVAGAISAAVVVDIGVVVDAGSGTTDGGLGSDGGNSTDGGNATDGGSAADGGFGTDGGNTADGGSGSPSPVDFYSCGCRSSGGGSLIALGAIALLLALRRKPTRTGSVLGGIVLVLAVWTTSAAAAGAVHKTSVAVLNLRAGPGVQAGLVDVVTESLSAELASRPGVTVLTSKDVEARLSFGRQRTLMGCQEDSSCMAEVGNALGVDKLLTGSLAKVGSSFVLNVQLVDTGGGDVLRFSQRIQSASEEAFLDLVPKVADSFFPRSKAASQSLDMPPPPPGTRQNKGHANAGPPPAPSAAAPVAVESHPEEVHPAATSAHVSLTLRGQAAPISPLHGAIAVHADYLATPAIGIGVGLMVTHPLGAFVRGSYAFNSDGTLRPTIAIEVPALFAQAAPVFGVGAAIGLEWLAMPWLALGAEVPAQYLFHVPAGAQALWVFGALTASVRL